MFCFVCLPLFGMGFCSVSQGLPSFWAESCAERCPSPVTRCNCCFAKLTVCLVACTSFPGSQSRPGQILSFILTRLLSFSVTRPARTQKVPVCYCWLCNAMSFFLPTLAPALVPAGYLAPVAAESGAQFSIPLKNTLSQLTCSLPHSCSPRNLIQGFLPHCD